MVKLAFGARRTSRRHAAAATAQMASEAPISIGSERRSSISARARAPAAKATPATSGVNHSPTDSDRCPASSTNTEIASIASPARIHSTGMRRQVETSSSRAVATGNTRNASGKTIPKDVKADTWAGPPPVACCSRLTPTIRTVTAEAAQTARPSCTIQALPAMARMPAPTLNATLALARVRRAPNRSPSMPAEKTITKAAALGVASTSSTMLSDRPRASAIGTARKVRPAAMSSESPTRRHTPHVMRFCAAVMEAFLGG